MVCAGPMLWELDQAADILKWYREFIVQAPEEINGFFAIPDRAARDRLSPKRCTSRKCAPSSGVIPAPWSRPTQILEPVRSYRPPAFEFFVPMPFPMLQGMFDGLYPPGLQWYWKADFFKELRDEAIAQHLEHGSEAAHHVLHHAPLSGQRRGAQSGANETACSYRDASWSEVIVGVDPDPANRAAHHGLGQCLLRRAAPLRRGRRLREFHDGRRRRPDSRYLSR